MRTILRFPALVLLLLTALLLVGCARGPDQERLQREAQEILTQELKPGLLEVVALKRRGSAPVPDAEDGSERVVVYANVTLRFAQDYAFGSWDKLSPASLAFLLGANEKGIVGIKPENKAGDLLYVYGSGTYQQKDGNWQSVAAVERATRSPDPDNTAPPLRSKQLIDKLAALVEVPPPGVGPNEDEVISEELDRAAENIRRRLDRRQHVFTFASGPRDGQYVRFGEALVSAARQAVGPRLNIRNRETEGSVQNVRLLLSGEADYSVVQSDVAARAVAGKGPFEHDGPASSLRALGSLFPEPIQIVVAASSPVRKIADLRGKRVDIGERNSGTHYDAGLILEAHGLKLRDLGQAREEGMERAIQRLQKGELDAFFVTTAAPVRSLQRLAMSPGIRLLSLQESAVDNLAEQQPGLVPITLPARTYPGQIEPVRTVATVALLLTTSQVPDSEAERLTRFVFSGADFSKQGSAEGVRVSRQTAPLGITIPMHPGASRFFGSGAKKP